MRYGITLAVMFCICGMLVGCSNSLGSQKNSVTTTNGDFTFSISTTESIYHANEFSSGHLLDLQVSITYTGKELEIKVWHGNPICTVTLVSETGDILLEKVIDDELLSSTLRYNEPYSFTYDGSFEYEKIGATC